MRLPDAGRLLGTNLPESRFLFVKHTLTISDRHEITDWFAEVKNLVADITVAG